MLPPLIITTGNAYLECAGGMWLGVAPRTDTKNTFAQQEIETHAQNKMLIILDL